MSVHIKLKPRPHSDNRFDKASGMSFIPRWWGRIVRYWQRRKTIAELAALDDRIPLDIGLCRGQIEDFVDSLSNAEMRMAPVARSVAASMQDAPCADRRRAA